MQRSPELELKSVILLAFAHFTVDFYTGFVAPLVPVLKEQMGFSITKAAFLISVFSLTSSMGQTIFGFLFDRVRNLAPVVLGPLCAGLFLSALGVAGSYPVAIALLVAGGLGVAAFHPQGAALAGLKSGRRHSVGVSIFVTGGTVGVGTGALAAASIVDFAGPGAIVYAVVVVVPAVLLLWRQLGRQKAILVHHRVTRLDRLPHGILVGLVALATVRALMILGYQAFLPLYLTQLGSSLATVGWTLFTLNLCGGIGGFTGGYWAERLEDRGVLYASFLVPVPLFASYLWVGSGMVGWTCLALASYTVGTGIPIVISLSQRSFPRQVATVSSVVMGVSWGIAGLLVTPLGAWAERVGIYTVLWCVALVGVIGFCLAVFLFRRRRAAPEGSPAPVSGSL